MEAITAQKFVRVTNNVPRLMHLPDQVNIQDANGQSPRALVGKPGFTLIPGGNNIPVDEWERAKKNPQVASWLKVKHKDSGGRPLIEEGGDTAMPEGVAPPESLTARNLAAATALIETESDPAVLRKWLDADQRPEVRQILQRKIGGAQASKQQQPRR